MVKISIITAVWNGARTIRDCIESVNGQTYPAEHIILDGKSTDRTLDVISQFYPSLGKVVSEPDRGIYDAMNKGIRLATGDVIGTLNADDIYANSNVLAKVARVFADKSLDACYGDLDYVDPVDTARVVRSWRSGAFNQKAFYWGWMPPHPTFFVRRKIYENYGDFKLDMGSAADYELMLRFIVKRRIRVGYIPEVLVNMRCGGVSNLTLRNRIAANRMDRRAWEVNALKPYPWTLWVKPLRKIGQFFVTHA
jgi:glycosyltransferase involved in cell wall biosynthesis